jgi:NAD(P) transhydrogenase subunit alpha
VTIIGHTNLPAEVPAHASQMYGKNLVTFLDHLLEEGALALDFSDEITGGSLVTHAGKLVNERLGGTLPLTETQAETPTEPPASEAEGEEA